MAEDKEQQKADMDAAQSEAAKELHNLPAQSVTDVANWWVKWKDKAGHRRLGRLMVAYIK